MAESETAMAKMKVVVVGDGAVGKTCLTLAYAEKDVPKDYVPNVLDVYRLTVKVKDVERLVELYDTGGQEEFEQLRLLAYVGAHVILICFSIDRRNSYENVRLTWIPEVQSKAENAKIILVGLKSDLRDAKDNKDPLLSPRQGRRLARSIGAVTYMECSAFTGVGVAEVFTHAFNAHFDPDYQPQNTGKCVLL